MMDIVLELLEQLDQGRERILVAIELLPDEALLESGTIGRFSVAEFLALQTAWEAELVTGLMFLDQGKKPENLLAALAQPELYEAKCCQEVQNRTLDRIFDDWQLVRVQLETWVEMFSERELKNRKRFNWLKGKSLKQLIGSLSFERESRFLPELETFAQGWLAEHSATEPPQFIPITAVFPAQDSTMEVDTDDEKPD